MPKTAQELRAEAERVKKNTRAADVIDFCDAVVAFIVSIAKPHRPPKPKRDRRAYQRNYMKNYRTKKRKKVIA